MIDMLRIRNAKLEMGGEKNNNSLNQPDPNSFRFDPGSVSRKVESDPTHQCMVSSV